MISRWKLAACCVLAAAGGAVAWADPCGMVPPIYVGNDVPIVRVGLQKTYVFYKDGMETFAIRPGFTGKVDDFGMLIPFPEPPALRKLPDDFFNHVDKAIDPPEVIVDLRPQPAFAALAGAGPPAAPAQAKSDAPLAINEVRVLRQEAVGMYEIAVLEAGSAAALKRWMDDHGYKYPEGMDKVCDEYVAIRWCFVAVKTKVGKKGSIDPRPGQRKVDGKMPPGSSFDGNVQAMAFRFRTKQLVVPMRLSAFNEGELRNVVYLLTDGPRKIRSIPEEYVVRQITGADLHRNVTGPLPVRVIGGTVSEIPEWRRASLPQERDPTPHNGQAKELFASDLLAVRQDRLAHPHEEAEKMLLRIGEELMLRGPDIDRMNDEALRDERKKTVDAAVGDIAKMTMTVVDGDFPREVLGGQNLQFAEYTMPGRRNSPQFYDSKQHAPSPRADGIRHVGKLSFAEPAPRWRVAWSRWAGPAGLGAVALLACAFAFRRRVARFSETQDSRLGESRDG